MDNEKKQFLQEKYQINDPEYVKWGQDKSGYPVKWVRTSLDGNWIIYNEDENPVEYTKTIYHHERYSFDTIIINNNHYIKM